MERALRDHPFFRSVDRETQSLLLPSFHWRPFDKGDVLIKEGRNDRDLYLILKGTLEVYARNGDRRFRVASMGPGSMVGEMAFFDAEVARAADVIATSDGELASFERQSYVELCANADPAAAALEKAVLGALADRMTSTNNTLADLLDKHKAGSLLAALARLFRRKADR
jgi:CRP/FNR family transcriptional regulator, cyclic AMP receptor protein